MHAARRVRAVGSGRVLAWGVGLLAVAVLLVVGLSGRGATASRPAPALPPGALVGRPVTLAGLLGAPQQAGAATAGGTGAAAPRGSRGAIVRFWASWCTPCQREAPAVERFAQSAAGRGRIVGVDYGESETAGPRAFLRRYGWTFPNLSDPNAHAGEAYGLVGLPSTFVIDARGRIRAALRGPQTAQSLTHALGEVES
jgi:cytochrome c biogenesis protein CcmG/thiol:disulfide interchange protein DsbE